MKIACGRDHRVKEDVTTNLVEWPGLYGRGKLLVAADLKLGEHFNKHEMERLSVLGLRCAPIPIASSGLFDKRRDSSS